MSKRNQIHEIRHKAHFCAQLADPLKGIHTDLTIIFAANPLKTFGTAPRPAQNRPNHDA